MPLHEFYTQSSLTYVMEATQEELPWARVRAAMRGSTKKQCVGAGSRGTGMSVGTRPLCQAGE